jgi:predicted Zn-dependent protease
LNRAQFEALAAQVCVLKDSAIDYCALYINAEDSIFIRFNHAKVRQSTAVQQCAATLTIVRRGQQLQSTVSLSGVASADSELLLAEKASLIEQLTYVPNDEYLNYPKLIVNTEYASTTVFLPSADTVMAAVTEHCSQLDFVGFYAGGTQLRARADSNGQRNWHASGSFNFSWCLYLQGSDTPFLENDRRDKAVKTAYAGSRWNTDDFLVKLNMARTQLEFLARPVRQLNPGSYRVLFSASAVGELLQQIGWSGFSHDAVRTGTASLVKMYRDGETLSRLVTLSEDPLLAEAPVFNSEGFSRYGQVDASIQLVVNGVAGSTLIGPRSAKQYQCECNGAGSSESPNALRMAAGSLKSELALAALGTGVYVSNLWYLNYSDQQASRMTGMTRFACFWIEDGKLVAPIKVMRFDDTFMRMFGSGLEALTDALEFMPDDATYGSRQLGSTTAPSALVNGVQFTL